MKPKHRYTLLSLITLFLTCPFATADQMSLSASLYSPGRQSFHEPTVDFLWRMSDETMRPALGLSGGSVGTSSQLTGKAGVSWPFPEFSSELLVLASLGVGQTFLPDQAPFTNFGGLEGQYHFFWSSLDLGLGWQYRIGFHAWTNDGLVVSVGYRF